MSNAIEHHAGKIMVLVFAAMVIGFMRMNSQSDLILERQNNVQKTVDALLSVAEMTRDEQLLRTDEIEWVQKMREIYPDWKGGSLILGK